MEIRPYSGNTKPFLYVVFHRNDQEKVQEIMERLHAKEFAICYEDEFDRRAQKRMQKSSLVIFFLSKEATIDERQNRAILFAVQNNLPVITIYLEPTELTPAQKLQLNTYQGLMYYEFSDVEIFYQKFLASSAMQFSSVTPAQKKDARRKSLRLTFGSVALGIGLFIALLTSVGGTVQAGSLLDDLGYSGSLGEISQVYVYATRTMDTNQGDSRPVTQQNEEYLEILRTGSVIAQGNVDDLSDFAQLHNLTELVFAGNEVEDISPLFTLGDLKYLDISSNPVKSLTGISRMDSLETLNLSYTKVKDLTPLVECPSLSTVYLSCDMRDSTGLSASQGSYEVIIGDHNWGEWEILQKPTPTAEGLSQRICKTCGEKQTQTLKTLDINNVGLEYLDPHIFGGYEEWGEEALPFNRYGVFIYGINQEYSYIFRKNGIIIPTSGREYMGENSAINPYKTHIYPDPDLMGDYDKNATYTLEASYNGETITYTIRHKFDR